MHNWIFSPKRIEMRDLTFEKKTVFFNAQSLSMNMRHQK